MRKTNVVLAVSLSALLAAAPATQPVRNLGDVDATFQMRTTAAKRAFDDELAKATEERLQGLRLLESRAMKAEDLDQAIAIRGKIEELKRDAGNTAADTRKEAIPPEIKARFLLESKLAGTRWHEESTHPNVIWTLNKDGTVSISDGRSAQWAAMTSTTILIQTSNGYVDVWRFDGELRTIQDVNGELTRGWSSVRAD